MPKFYCVSNWKMNGSRHLALQYIEALKTFDSDVLELIICPPFTHLTAFDKAGGSLKVYAQNIHHTSKGPLTGEVR
jgi:triosephosphate isomerase (TIM)